MDPVGALATLVGACVRRIDLPAHGMLAIGLDAGCTLVVGTARSARGVGLVDRRPKGDPASALVQKLRAHVEGAVLTGLRVEEAALVLSFARDSDASSIVCALDGAAGAIAVLDAAGHVLHSNEPHTYAKGALFTATKARVPLALPQSLAELEAAGERLLRARTIADGEARHNALLRAIRRALSRAIRRLHAIDEDLIASAEASTLRVQAALLLAHAHEVTRDATEIRVVDEAQDPPVEHVMQLTHAHGGTRGPRAAIEAAQKLFLRARKLHTSARIAEERRTRTQNETTKLAALLERLSSPLDDASLTALATEAHALGIAGARSALGARADASEKKRRDRPEERVPYRRFVANGERAVLVGRGAADNDALTQRHARPHDLWLHARAVAGAHVIVPLARGEVCPPELLIDAATLAAHFSDARNEPIVEVQHTARRFVRKPRGSAPGAVLVDREKVIVLRLEPKRLARLLRSESLT